MLLWGAEGKRERKKKPNNSLSDLYCASTVGNYNYPNKTSPLI